MQEDNNELAKENRSLRDEIEKKYNEIEELKMETLTLNKNLENLLEINESDKNNDKIQEAFRNSMKLNTKA